MTKSKAKTTPPPNKRPLSLPSEYPDPWIQAQHLRGNPPQAILDQLGIKTYPTDLLKWSKEALLKEFGRGAAPKNINKSLFIKNVIWQTYQRIQAGEKPFDVGNIRSFWYHIKDTMDRVGATRKGDGYAIVSDMFVLMVRSGLFKYRDFGFEDDDKGNRWLGSTFAHVILFAEKTSYTDFLQEMNREYDITTLAAGGQTSYLSCEYFVTELATQGINLKQPFIIFTIVDFDPAGDTIAARFIENLKDNGIKNFHLFPLPISPSKKLPRKDLVTPAYMNPEQCKRVFRIPLAVRRSGRAQTWANQTGGVNGKKDPMWGIETIVMPKAQMRQVFEQELSQVIHIDPEPIAKRRHMHDLRTQLNAWALHKLQQET